MDGEERGELARRLWSSHDWKYDIRPSIWVR